MCAQFASLACVGVKNVGASSDARSARATPLLGRPGWRTVLVSHLTLGGAALVAKRVGLDPVRLSS